MNVINTPWYTGNRYFHKDVKRPLFDDHITALTEGCDSKLPGTGNPLFWQLGRHLCQPRFDHSLLKPVLKVTEISRSVTACHGKEDKPP